MTLTEETARQLLRELRQFNALQKRTLATSWVKASTVKMMTGWDNERMKRARINGEVKMKKDATGIWYDISSINPIHLIKQTA